MQKGLSVVGQNNEGNASLVNTEGINSVLLFFKKFKRLKN